MRIIMGRGIGRMAVGVLVCSLYVSAAQTGVYFDDSEPVILRLGNSYFELSLSKTNGGILDLRDKTAGASLTLGSVSGCLWGANFGASGTTTDFIGGCSYSPGGSNMFGYRWNAANSTLMLSYAADRSSPKQADAILTITVGADNSFGLQLQISNRWGQPLNQVLLPNDLQFSSTAVQYGYLPFKIPGVRLNPGFFRSGRSQLGTYPGSTAFMDYAALDTGGGHLAIYTINPAGPLDPVTLGFASAAAPGAFRMVHAFQTAVKSDAVYTSPIVRIRVGQSVHDTILAFRTENGIDAYPSIQQKTGSKFEQLVRAPLVNAQYRDFIGKPFLSAIPDLDQFANPVLLHPSAFQPGGHDHSSPDFLPPDPLWGTTDDFRIWVQAAQSRNLLVMPYINPTWWTPDSPTTQAIAPMLNTVAVLDASGNPVVQDYGSPGNPDIGYVVCPACPIVQNRTASLMSEWQSAVPTDFLYLDQIGSRQWMRDFNPAESTQTGYSDTWLQNWTAYAGQGLFTEDGWDRLAAKGLGFLGGLLRGSTSFQIAAQRYGINSDGNTYLGAGNWDPYPLATWLMHDKILFYQGNLELQTTAENTEVLTWDLQFGEMFNYLWPGNPAAPPTPGRIKLAHLLARVVGPQYGGVALSNYTELSPEVVTSTFGNVSTIANWQQQVYTVDGSGIIPGGYLTRTADASLTAGAFSGQLNGQPLSPGAHYLVIQAVGRTVTVWQPVGDDSPLTINLPGDWNGQLLRVMALDQDSNRLGPAPFSVINGQITFPYAGQFHGSAVDRYEIENDGSKLPAVTNGASFLETAIAPGEIISVFGAGIGPATPIGPHVGANGTFDTQLGPTQVLFDNVPAPMVYAGLNQVSAIVPYSVAGRAVSTVQVLVNGSDLPALELPVAATAPGIFTVDASGGSGGAILNQDQTLNTPSNPAPRCSIISIYGTGAGQMLPAGVDGQIAGVPPAQPLIPVKVQIGGTDAEVLYAGAAPGLVSGVIQVNARVPAGIAPGGIVPIVLTIGHGRSAAGVTVAVQ
jgi:uncharacterized protein (TIGR03437 family)